MEILVGGNGELASKGENVVWNDFQIVAVVMEK